MGTLAAAGRTNEPADALRQKAAVFLHRAFDCSDALIRDELRRLAQEFLMRADELERVLAL